MINFALPGLYEHYEVLIPLCSLFRTHNEYFKDNININAAFGNFQFSAWDGGRIFLEGNYHHATKEQIIKLKEIYNEELDIPMRFIFTSALTDPDLCHSYFDNFVAQLCENNKNEIVVASSMLENYLRETYPKYSFISSTTKCVTHKEEAIKEILNSNYKMICLDYNLNKNKQFLDSIPAESRNKIEFLVNAICPPGCPFRKNHYKLNSLYSYNYGVPYTVGECGITKNNLYPSNYKNNFTYNEIVEYNKNGFENFKLEGRTFDGKSLILNLVSYLIKEEYQFYIINFLLDMANNFDLNIYSLKSFRNIVV